MMGGVSVWWDEVLEFFYPSYCLGCGESLQYSHRELFCPLCHMSFHISDCHLNNHHPLKRRLREQFPFDLILSKYRYPNKSRTIEGLIRGFKYENLKYIGFQEGQKYGTVIQPFLYQAGVSILVPVPLHRRKRMKRGYNQSIEWSKGISSTTGIQMSDRLVHRIKYTQSQTLLDKKGRMKNLEKAFRVTAHKSGLSEQQNHHFLLLDDVVTSGATLTELAKTIKASFPMSRFSVCTLAYKDY